jgi:hypothetical protein
MPKKDDEHEELEVEITIVDKDFKRLESGQKLTLGALTLSETPIIISLRRLRSKKRKNETTEETESSSGQ